MLRITKTNSPTHVLFKLEGKLVGPWVEEFASTLGAHNALTGAQLDLKALNYVDAAGVELLSRALARGITLVACSDFVSAILHLENHP